MNCIKLVFNMMWFMEILKIWIEEQLLINYYAKKDLKMLKILKYDRYQGGLASVVYKYFDKKSSGGGIQNEIISNKQLAEELQNP